MRNKLPFILTVFVLFSKAHFAQAPVLGTSSNFVLFTTAGAVSNTGISQVTGNVGTNSGSSTGFGNVNGVMHDNDGASGQAATDLQIAYNQLDAATPAFFPAPLLGNGDTLVAGVYSINGVTTLDSNLYLDAKGNGNAVFIFQIEAAFSANANAKIKLLNGAQSCNVFWKVEGAVSIADQVFMRGTILAHNGAIGLGTSDTLEGRALVIAGAVNVNGVLAYIPVGCGRAVLTGPAAPAMATAGCFAIFSGNGPVVNTGITHVTGDVGTNVGATTGYLPEYVTGYIHVAPDGFTTAAAADLLNGYNYLNLLPDDIQLLYPEQFGHNLVLTPHTYIMNGAATFTDTVYLNALGNTNAVFVIKVRGALTTNAFSKVLLINGARAKNVYWLVDGAVTIENNSIFNGTIVCKDGAITINTNTTVNGRALTTSGALSTKALIVTSPSGDCNPLPVNWVYFRGKPVQKTVLLEWGTTNEINNGFFTLEKGTDGQRFEMLTTVSVTKEVENTGHHYSFTDQQPFDVGFYRISQTDKDGQRRYYRTIQVKLNAKQGLAVRPYVKDSYIYLRAVDAVPGNGTLQLYSMDGKKISSQKITLTREESTYKIDKSLRKGMYILYIESKGEKVYYGKVMVL